MKHYRGIYGDTFLECDAENEEEAQRILKEMLIEMITMENEPFIIWGNELEGREQ